MSKKIFHPFHLSGLWRAGNAMQPIPNNVKLLRHDPENAAFYLAKVKEDGSYDPEWKVLVFTDLHFDSFDNVGPRTAAELVAAIEREQPDFIGLLGDVTLVTFDQLRTRHFVRLMTKTSLYWTAVLGNHEGEPPLSVTQQGTVRAYLKSPKACVQYAMPGVAGWGNQVIHLMADENRIAQSLYFMDSGGRNQMGKLTKGKYTLRDSHPHIQASQTAWYERALAAARAQYGDMKSMILMHMPVWDYREAWALTEKGELPLLWEQHGESICADHTPDRNGGLPDKARELGSTWAFVCGHDHANDYAVDYKGLRLIYNRPGGFATMCMGDNVRQGYTRYSIHRDGKVDLENISYNK